MQQGGRCDSPEAIRALAESVAGSTEVAESLRLVLELVREFAERARVDAEGARAAVEEVRRFIATARAATAEQEWAF